MNSLSSLFASLLSNLFPDALVAKYIFASGWTIVHSLWQASCAALFLALGLMVLRGRPARDRYALAAATLAVTFVAAVWTFAAYYNHAERTERERAALQERMFDALESTVVEKPVAEPSASNQPAISTNTTPANAAKPAGQPSLWHRVKDARSALANIAALKSPENEAQKTAMTAFAEEFKTYFNRHLPFIVMLWFVGVVMLTLKLLAGLAYAQRMKTYRTNPAASTWQERTNALLERIGGVRTRLHVQLLESRMARVPMTLGSLKPVILMPLGVLGGMPPEHIEVILAHELAHIVRRDYLVNLLQSTLETLMFYHPAVWWMARVMREEREHACDDLAVAACGDSFALANALVSLRDRENSENGAQSASQPAFAMAATGGDNGNQTELLGRVKRLLGLSSRRSPISAGTVAACVLLCSVSLTAGVVLQPVLKKTASQTFAAATNALGIKSSDAGTSAKPSDEMLVQSTMLQTLDSLASGADSAKLGTAQLAHSSNGNALQGRWKASFKQNKVTFMMQDLSDGDWMGGTPPSAPLPPPAPVTPIPPTSPVPPIAPAPSAAPRAPKASAAPRETKSADREIREQAKRMERETREQAKRAQQDAERQAQQSSRSSSSSNSWSFGFDSKSFKQSFREMFDENWSSNWGSHWSWNWNTNVYSSMAYEKFEGLDADKARNGGALSFRMTREAGVFTFTGESREGRASGTYTFTPSAAFVAKLKTAGFTNIRMADVYELAMSDLSFEKLQKYGATGVNLDEAIEYAHRGIKPEYVKAAREAGFTVDEVEEFGVRGISVETAKAYKQLGFDTDETADLAVRGIKAEYVKAMKEAGFDADEIADLAVRGISVETAKKYKEAGFDADEIADLAVRGIKPDYVKTMKDAGFSKGDIEDIGVRGISAETAKKYKEAGFDADEIADLAVRGIKPEYVKAMKDVGFSTDEIADIGVRGISVETAKTFKQAGFDADDIADLAVRGISVETVLAYKKAGFNKSEIEDLAVRGIKAETAREMKKLGFSADDIAELGMSGISTDFVKGMKTMGFSSSDIRKLGWRGVKLSSVEKLKKEGLSNRKIVDVLTDF